MIDTVKTEEEEVKNQFGNSPEKSPDQVLLNTEMAMEKMALSTNNAALDNRDFDIEHQDNAHISKQDIVDVLVIVTGGTLSMI